MQWLFRRKRDAGQPIGKIFVLLPFFLLAGVQAAETAPLEPAASGRVSSRPELTVTTLGFGSCARQDRPQPIWDGIHAAGCDAFVLCGDNIYADTTDPAVFRAKYALLDAMPGFAGPPRFSPHGTITTTASTTVGPDSPLRQWRKGSSATFSRCLPTRRCAVRQAFTIVAR